jgi:cytochrome b pre-mRNA-processing protein 3
MILSLFRHRRSPIPADLHAKLVAAARHPALYAEIGIPDTVQGRFEALVLTLWLFLRRTKSDAALTDLAQEVVDQTFRELDRGLREQGVGDLSVPRHMKKMAALVYGRAAAFDAAAADGDLAQALRHALFADEVCGDVARLVDYVSKAEAHLAAEVTASDLLAGRVSFPDP